MTTASLTRHLRILEPRPGVFAYYDGRVPGHSFADGPNWVDDGALALGIATYAIVEGTEALVYDTHVSPEHGRAIRAHLEGLRVGHIRVVYSHWHLDHVAGSAAFADCEIIANRRTADHLARRRPAIEAGTESGPPAINPLILPTRRFSGRMTLHVGATRVELIEANIHSDDATVLWLPGSRTLLAGDTVEDCVTYVDASEDFTTHLADLDRLAALGPLRILPDHGDPGVIAAGGYGPDLIAATQTYIRWLMRLGAEPGLAETPLATAIAGDLVRGTLRLHPAYEAVHRENIARTLAHFGHPARSGDG